MNDTKLKAWEIAMLLALCVFFCAGMWAGAAREELAENLIRLHVIANSDSDADQAAKLQMRDRVLAVLSPLLAGCESQEDAVDIILNHADELETLGDIRVSLDTEHYPTREYDTFSLPAGDYLSLRVIMGEGKGHNWWCVVFPPLCTEALSEPAEDVFGPLSDQQEGLITQDSAAYIIKFRLLEWWDALAQKLS